MANLIDNPAFSENEVYQIQATDAVEGAASGASFNGAGLSNQPHQQLANRTSFLKHRQDTNIGNISALQSFTAMFKGLMGSSGYLEVPFLDVNRGLTVAFVQWGVFEPSGGVNGDHAYVVTWPVAFPNSCVFAIASMLYKTGATPDLGVGVRTDANSNPLLTTTQGTFFVNLFNVGGNPPGFTWIAVGF